MSLNAACLADWTNGANCTTVTILDRTNRPSHSQQDPIDRPANPRAGARASQAMRPATDSSCSSSGIHADPYYGDNKRTTRSTAAELVASLYDRVLPNPHPVRLESRKGQEDGQLAPLNPLYVRRFATEIARHVQETRQAGKLEAGKESDLTRIIRHEKPHRDAVGRQFEALALLLPRLQNLCPREVATLVAHVVEVFARSPSPTYRCVVVYNPEVE